MKSITWVSFLGGCLCAGCGAIAAAPTPGAEASASPASQGAVSSSGGDASGDGGAGQAMASGTSTCSLALTGAVDLTASDTKAAATFEYENTDSGVAPYLELTCSFSQGGVGYEFTTDVLGVNADGVYVADRVLVQRTCTESCPGDFDFSAFPPGPTCSVVVTGFAAPARGGLTAHVDCPTVVIDDYEDSSDVSSVAVTGDFVLAPAPRSRPDAGTSDVAVDAGPPTCAMQVTGEYDEPALEGTGFEVSSALFCAASAQGTIYELSIPLAAGSFGDGSFEVSGDSWCASDCSTTYYPENPCIVKVLEDQGVNGRFVATFECDAMAMGSLDGGSGTTTKVTGTVNGIHRPTPNPG